MTISIRIKQVSDIDGLYFHKRFKDSGHPFYDEVYKKAAKIDKLLADNMVRNSLTFSTLHVLRNSSLICGLFFFSSYRTHASSNKRA